MVYHERVTEESWRLPPKRAYKPRSVSGTSAIMGRVRSKNTKAELALRRAVWAAGFRYRLHCADVIGRPDLVFRTLRVAVFVDGDYWHGRSLLEGGERSLRQVIRGKRYEWWRAKLQRNIDRDRYVTSTLTAKGWTVIRVWESDVRTRPAAAIRSVVVALRKARRKEANKAVIND